MREIKFRVWDKVNNLMYQYGSDEACGLWEEGCDFMGMSFLHCQPNVIWQQYTGLKDKNGKEIYKGDIIQQNNNLLDLVQVCFGEFGVRVIEDEEVIDNAVGWYCKVIKTDALSDVEPFCYDMPLNGFWIEKLESIVIGNIYENPELLND